MCCFQILKQREPNWIEWLGILNHHQAHRHRYSDVCALCILFYILPFYLWYRCQWDPYDWKVYSLWSLAWYYEVSADRVKVESMNRGDSMGDWLLRAVIFQLAPMPGTGQLISFASLPRLITRPTSLSSLSNLRSCEVAQLKCHPAADIP